MEWVIQFDEIKGLVQVQATGALEESPLREMTRELRDAVLRHGSKRVLVDYSQTVSQLEPYEIFERPKILAALGFPADVRVAVLYAKLDENAQFLENVYRNKNFAVRVFAERAAALSWLESQAT
jgi:hypothetical protein